MKRFCLIFTSIIFLVSCSGNKQSKTTNVKQDRLSVMTFNIRYDNAEDAPHNWENRRDAMAELIQTYKPSILGMQEVLHHQLEYLKVRMTEFAYIGIGREDGDTIGEYAPIAYDTARLELLKHRYVWLSETPDRPSKGWDAACERIATLAVLHDRISGDTIGVINTHFDHVGQIARAQSVSLIHREVASLASECPDGVLVLGDFNASPEESVITEMLDSAEYPRLFDTGLSVHGAFAKEGTYHDFNKEPLDRRPLIDYIFFTEPLRPASYQIISTTERPDLILSDHHAVFSEFYK